MNSSRARHVGLFAATLMIGPLTAVAQQNLPRPIVLYRPPVQGRVTPKTISTPTVPSSVPRLPQHFSGPRTVGTPGATNTVISPMDAMMARPVSDARSPQSNGTYPSSSGSASNPSNGTQADSATNDSSRMPQAQPSLPTNQVMQNPSGLYNMSHSGITASQQYAPNSYFGPQFQNWTNQRGMPHSTASFGEMSRNQPGPFGGYVAPNTYLGSGFSSWNNLSSGNIAPAATGGWNYSTWP
jgi:hypothetical protein